MARIVPRCRGVTGLRARVEALQPPWKAVAYLDPPYIGTSRYGEAGTVETMLGRWSGKTVYVSELRPLTDNARTLRSRVGTGVSGFAKAVDASEYLSLFNADWPTPDLSNVRQLSMFDSPLVIEVRAG